MQIRSIRFYKSCYCLACLESSNWIFIDVIIIPKNRREIFFDIIIIITYYSLHFLKLKSLVLDKILHAIC